MRRAKELFRHPKMVRIDLSLPKQIITGLKLIRSATGIPTSQWLRAQVYMAVQLELARQPGFFWLRPGSKVYRLDFAPGDLDTPIPTPVATSEGGERVWIIEFVGDWYVGREDHALPMSRRQGAVICDISSPRGINMRRVAVAAADVLPRENLWVTGLGASQERRAREQYRERVTAKAARRAARADHLKHYRFQPGGKTILPPEGVDDDAAPEQHGDAGSEEEASPPA